jgi:hypothetical protein
MMKNQLQVKQQVTAAGTITWGVYDGERLVRGGILDEIEAIGHMYALGSYDYLG